MDKLLYAIEAGGTKFICAVGSSPETIVSEKRIPTTSPNETMGRVIDFFRSSAAEFGPTNSLGIGSFGPLDPATDSPTYGYITSTPKSGWTNTDVVGFFTKAMAEISSEGVKIPVSFDTDVNAAALAEGRYGAAKGVSDYVYVTIGTGIGAGIISGGTPVHGMLHPEAGHLLPRRDREKDPFVGICPYHGDCLEGLASGSAMEKRWGKKAEELASGHPAWELEAEYLGWMCASFVLLCSTKRIVLGGGVMNQRHLFPLVREKTAEILNGYVKHDSLSRHMDSFIVPPLTGTRAGIMGSLILAENALSG